MASPDLGIGDPDPLLYDLGSDRTFDDGPCETTITKNKRGAE